MEWIMDVNVIIVLKLNINTKIYKYNKLAEDGKLFL